MEKEMDYFKINSDYWKKLKKQLNEYELSIMEIIIKKFHNIKTDGNNTDRVSHITKIKTITIEDLYEIILKNEWKCSCCKELFSNDIDYLKPSIDRINSDEPYTKENIQIVNCLIQNLKNCYSIDEFKRGITSIATRNLIISDNIKKVTLGGGMKKGIKNWKQVFLNKPIRMNKPFFYIYDVLHDNDHFLSIEEIINYISNKYKINQRKKIIISNLETFKEYITKDNQKYKLKSDEEIININKLKDFTCVCCEKTHNILEFRKRDSRSNLTYVDCNLHHTICTYCNTKKTTNYKNSSPERFIWRQIQSRKDKSGNINLLNINEIVSDKCYISGLPIVYENDSGRFNQASPDRINSNGKYDLSNTKITCLMLNLGRNKFDISNEILLDIINKTYLNF